MAPTFVLQLPDLDRTLPVARFRGTERISRIPRFSLVVRLPRDDEVALRNMLGTRAVLVMAHDRAIYGIVERIGGRPGGRREERTTTVTLVGDITGSLRRAGK